MNKSLSITAVKKSAPFFLLWTKTKNFLKIIFMSPQKLDLRRFKKRASGIKEFAAFIEQTHTHRTIFIREAEKQDADFYVRGHEKSRFEELVFLDENLISAIFQETSPKLVAFFALHGASKELREKFLSQMGVREVRL